MQNVCIFENRVPRRIFIYKEEEAVENFMKRGFIK
jgi:hypothetical protein